jgi:hypothetical protein
MAILYFFIRATVVAALEYENKISLYKLSHMSNTVDVRRNNEFQSMEQQNLVPGDVVALKPGITYCDMVYKIKAISTSYRICLVQSTCFVTTNSNPWYNKTYVWYNRRAS